MIDKPSRSPQLAVVIPTKDRPGSLRRTLKSLAEQSRPPEQVIVVASGGEESQKVTGEFTQFPALYIYEPQASIAAARNKGAQAARHDIELVAFVDDDVAFDPGAVERMLNFWERAPMDVGGAAFNLRNNLAPETRRKWALGPVRRLYRLFLGGNPEKGKVRASGFPTPIYPVNGNASVQWLETMAVVFRRSVLNEYSFDEFFAGYSYLEFLDFTYSVSRRYRLFVVGGAWVTHYPSPIRSSYLLGKKQVLNRIYFVLKHPELSLLRCICALALHACFNVAVSLMLRDAGYLKRACGNLVGFAQAVSGHLVPVSGGIR